MAQHQHILCSSSSSSGAGSCSGRSKAAKPKKVPQRGLGVAQLEKIRIEEQRKRMQAIETVNKTFGNNSNAFVSPANESGDIHHFPGPNLHRSGGNWACNNFQGEEHLGYALWPQNQANAPSEIAHVLNSQIEPPSNQSPSQQQQQPADERCKMVGVKRPYPFALDNSSMPLPYSFTDHFHTVAYSGRSSSPCSKDPRIKHTIASPVNSSTLPPRDTTEHNGKLRGDFLTLAPPTAANPTDKIVVAPSSGHHGAVELGSSRGQEKQGRQCLEGGSNRAALVMRLSESRNEDGTKEEGAIDLDLKL